MNKEKDFTSGNDKSSHASNAAAPAEGIHGAAEGPPVQLGRRVGEATARNNPRLIRLV